MTLVDTHAHLYHGKFSEDRDAMIQRAISAGVERLYLPNIDDSSIEAMLDLTAAWPKHCFPMMGMHPCSVVEGEADLGRTKALLFNPPEGVEWVAVGEIGLDYNWDQTRIPQQKEAYALQMDWAIELDLPIVIHSRDSLDDTIAMVEERVPNGIRGVFHCFNGTVEQGRRIIDAGFYLGIGGVATFKNGGLDTVIPELGTNRLVLETDAPYLSPVPFRGKRNESAYVPHVAEKLAGWFELTTTEIARITTANADELFRFGG